MLARASSIESVSQNQNPIVKFKENEVLNRQSKPFILCSQCPRKHNKWSLLYPFSVNMRRGPVAFELRNGATTKFVFISFLSSTSQFSSLFSVFPHYHSPLSLIMSSNNILYWSKNFVKTIYSIKAWRTTGRRLYHLLISSTSSFVGAMSIY